MALAISDEQAKAIIMKYEIEGKNRHQISKEIGCHYSTVKRVLNNREKNHNKSFTKFVQEEAEKRDKENVLKAMEAIKGKQADNIVKMFLDAIESEESINKLKQENFMGLVKAFKDFVGVRIRLYEVDKKEEMFAETLDNQNNLFETLLKEVKSTDFDPTDVIDPESIKNVS